MMSLIRSVVSLLDVTGAIRCSTRLLGIRKIASDVSSLRERRSQQGRHLVTQFSSSKNLQWVLGLDSICKPITVNISQNAGRKQAWNPVTYYDPYF